MSLSLTSCKQLFGGQNLNVYYVIVTIFEFSLKMNVCSVLFEFVFDLYNPGSITVSLFRNFEKKI